MSYLTEERHLDFALAKIRMGEVKERLAQADEVRSTDPDFLALRADLKAIVSPGEKPRLEVVR